MTLTKIWLRLCDNSKVKVKVKKISCDFFHRYEFSKCFTCFFRRKRTLFLPLLQKCQKLSIALFTYSLLPTHSVEESGGRGGSPLRRSPLQRSRRSSWLGGKKRFYLSPLHLGAMIRVITVCLPSSSFFRWAAC